MALKSARDTHNNLTFIWDTRDRIMLVTDDFGHTHQGVLTMHTYDDGNRIAEVRDVHGFTKIARDEHGIGITNTAKAILIARNLTRTEPTTFPHYTAFYIPVRRGKDGNGYVVELSKLGEELRKQNIMIHDDLNF